MTDITNSAAEFSRQINQLVAYVEDNSEQIIKKACVDLYRRIVERTPVDTGRAKASWGISTGSDVPAVSAGKLSDSEIAEIINSHVGEFRFGIDDDQITIMNNLEYISYLEAKGSQQAPVGMVAVSLTEFNDHFRKALESLTDKDGFESL